MKNKLLLKATSLLLAATFMCSSGSSAFFGAKNNVCKAESHGTQPVTAEIVPAEQRLSICEKLENAVSSNDKIQISQICDDIISELNKTKADVEKEAAEIAEWADSEILSRQKKFEKENL